jgi:hypothetical protein
MILTRNEGHICTGYSGHTRDGGFSTLASRYDTKDTSHGPGLCEKRGCNAVTRLLRGTFRLLLLDGLHKTVKKGETLVWFDDEVDAHGASGIFIFIFWFYVRFQ